MTRRRSTMTENRRTRRWIRTGATWLLALALAPALAIPVVADLASAETEEEELAKKADWQGRYRALRNNAARMRENATKLRRAYGLAQHANYPRGGAREDFRRQVEKAERDADDYASKVESFHDEARANEIPPGWLFEVDDEPIDPGLPADQDESELEPEDDREGRNPIYLDDEEDEDAEEEDSDADSSDEDEDA